MPSIPVTLIKGDKISSRTDYRDNLPTNMYAVPKEVLGAKGFMLQFPGITNWILGYGIDRGAIYNERLSLHLRVSGTHLISIDTDGTVNDLGNIPGIDQATLSDFYSFNTQAIIANGNMFLYEPVGGLTQIVDEDLGVPIDGVWIDGYYFLTDGEYLYHTDLNDETSIDPLKYATAEFMPDPSIGVSRSKDDKAMVWGRYTIEYFSNEASANFAFSRVSSRTQKIGIVATHAKCSIGEVWFIIGGSKNEAVSAHIVYSGTSQKIATKEIDQILSSYTEPELADIRIDTIQEQGINLVLFHLPNETLCFNVQVAKDFGNELAWSIVKTDIKGDDPYAGINAIFDARIGKWIVGSIYTNAIGQISDSITTHFGAKVEWILYSPFINLESMSVNELKIETLPGHNTLDDATVAISLTFNGVSFGTEVWMDYGSPANYNQKFILRRLGYINSWVGFKFRGVSTSRMAFGLVMVNYG